MTEHWISETITSPADRHVPAAANIYVWIDRTIVAQRAACESGEADPIAEHVVRALLVSKLSWVMQAGEHRRTPFDSVRSALTEQAQLYRDAAYGLAVRPVASDGSEPVLSKANNLRSAAVRIDAIVRALVVQLAPLF